MYWEVNTMNFHRTFQYSQMVELTSTLYFSTPSVHFGPFFDCNFDVLNVGRCAPSQSYIKPAERCMSLLNIGLYDLALERGHAGASEKITSSCKTIKRLKYICNILCNICSCPCTFCRWSALFTIWRYIRYIIYNRLGLPFTLGKA